MTSDATARGVPVTPEFKKLVTDAAWDDQTTTSALVRDAIDNLLKDASQLAGWGEDPGNGPKGGPRLTFLLEEEQWEQLKAAGWLNRKSLAATIRIALKHFLDG